MKAVKICDDFLTVHEAFILKFLKSRAPKLLLPLVIIAPTFFTGIFVSATPPRSITIIQFSTFPGSSSFFTMKSKKKELP